jgi:hypothetical protein
MITLLPIYEFEFQEYEDSEPLKGVYRDLNSKELKELENKNKEYSKAINQGKDLEKKLKRVIELSLIAEKNDDWKTLETLTTQKHDLEDKLSDLSDKTKPTDKENELIKWKMSICLSGQDKDKIIALAESYGYSKIQNIIFQAINEKKLGK